MLSAMPRRPLVPPQLTKGPFTLAEARQAGLERWHLDAASLRRLGPETYVASQVREAPLQRLQAAARRLPPNAAFSGLTAAWLHGIDVEPCDPIEATVRPDAGVSARSGIALRRSALGDNDVERCPGHARDVDPAHGGRGLLEAESDRGCRRSRCCIAQTSDTPRSADRLGGPSSRAARTPEPQARHRSRRAQSRIAYGIAAAHAHGSRRSAEDSAARRRSGARNADHRECRQRRHSSGRIGRERRAVAGYPRAADGLRTAEASLDFGAWAGSQ